WLRDWPPLGSSWRGRELRDLLDDPRTDLPALGGEGGWRVGWSCFAQPFWRDTSRCRARRGCIGDSASTSTRGGASARSAGDYRPGWCSRLHWDLYAPRTRIDRGRPSCPEAPQARPRPCGMDGATSLLRISEALWAAGAETSRSVDSAAQ